MAKKMIAVFLVCIVVVAALQLSNAESKLEAKYDAKFKSCYETCEKECLDEGTGYSFCEVKCDEDCGEKEVADKLDIKLAH